MQKPSNFNTDTFLKELKVHWKQMKSELVQSMLQGSRDRETCRMGN
jgi:hypothetical protein